MNASHSHLIRTAYLRVYEPEHNFSEDERSVWSEAPPEADLSGERPIEAWLVTGGLPTETMIRESAFVRRIEGVTYVCPWRTRLRMLAGLLAFRESVPAEVADAFVPEREAREAARQLAALDERWPDIRSHIIHANWHVPLRWFAAFDPADRILLEDQGGLRIRYETRVGLAVRRLRSAVGVLEGAWIDDGVVAALHELTEWLDDFSSDALLELDYGSVAGLFADEELVDDNCAAQVAECVRALESGDGERAGEIFGELTDRWATLRANEVIN